MFDVLISGGEVVDGSGQMRRRADVGIVGGAIASVGALAGKSARLTLDAQGLVVSPGFIDVHTHSDMAILAGPEAESAVRQGATTHVFPNCGMGAAPFVGEARGEIEEDAAVYGVGVSWRTVADYFRCVEQVRPSINVVPMIAHGTVRTAVMGYSDRAPSAAELGEMKTIVDDAMRAGVRGLCSGLRYVPSGYATTDELVELARVVGPHGGVYATHMRSEGDNGDWFAAIGEALSVGRESGIRVQISHLKALGSDVWGNGDKALALIGEARADGIDVMCDQYPYSATSSTLFVLFPQWSQEGGYESFAERISQAAAEGKIRESFARTLAIRGGGSRMTIAAYSPDVGLEGKTLADVAKLWGTSEYLAARKLLEKSRGQVKMIFHVLDEGDVETIFRSPIVMVASDGYATAPSLRLAGGSRPHPRSYGCFPRVLGDLVREKRLVTLEEAVRKMTHLPAERFRLERRGLLRRGWAADITVFDPERVSDLASFDSPEEFPQGIAYVVVNGAVVVDHGRHTGERPGRVLYSGSLPAVGA